MLPAPWKSVILLPAALASIACGDVGELPEGPTGPDAEAPDPPAEGEGEQPAGDVIGDPSAPAALSLVFRDGDGRLQPLQDGAQVPLLLPFQGGKVIYVGIAGTNVSRNVQLTAGLYDDCASPAVVFALEGRPVTLEEGPDGLARPIDDPSVPFVGNLANVPMCPTFGAARDVDGVPTRLEVRVKEELRPGEAAPREHMLTATITPTCADAACACECDADYSLERTSDEQCPTIHDNDTQGCGLNGGGGVGNQRQDP